MTDHRELFFKPGISPTSINQFFESPSRFWKYSSLNPNKERVDQTEAMIFGRLVHCLVLTPEAFDQEFSVAPAKMSGDLDTMDDMKELLTPFFEAQGQKLKSSIRKPELMQFCRQYFPHRAIYEDKVSAFRQALGKRTIIMPDQLQRAKSMQDAMLANRAVRQLIGNGLSESPFCWFPDGEGGLMKKCRLDYVRAGLVIEYKTDVSPCEEDFSRTLFQKRGYHRQLATQVEAATLMNGEVPNGAILIVQDKEIHDDIAIWALKPEDVQLGHDENAYAMADIKRRMALMTGGASEKDAWRTFPEEIRTINRPKWYKPKNVPQISE